MRRHQRGITTLGWIILLIPVAIVFYAGVRLAPVYLNYMNVAHTLQQVSTEPFDVNGLNSDVERRVDLESPNPAVALTAMRVDAKVSVGEKAAMPNMERQPRSYVNWPPHSGGSTTPVCSVILP